MQNLNGFSSTHCKLANIIDLNHITLTNNTHTHIYTV